MYIRVIQLMQSTWVLNRFLTKSSSMAFKEDDVRCQDSCMIACRDEKQTVQLNDRSNTEGGHKVL